MRKEEQGQWLDKLIDVIQKQGLDSTTVEKSHVEKAAKVYNSLQYCKLTILFQDFFPIIGVLSK